MVDSGVSCTTDRNLQIEEKSMNQILRLAYTSPDTVSFRMYYENEGIAVTKESAFIELPKTDTLEYDLREVQTMQGFDGVYEVSFTSIDDGGLEGPLGQNMTIPFDFVVPEPPTAEFSDV